MRAGAHAPTLAAVTALAYQSETSDRAYPFSAEDVADLQRAAELQRASGESYRLDDLEQLLAKLPGAGGEVVLSTFELLAIPAAGRNLPERDPGRLRLEALWERQLGVRDEALEQNPEGVNELRWLMSDLSELTEQASWTGNTPYTAWAAAQGETSHRRADNELPPVMVSRLRELFALTGGIWVWPGDDFSGADWMAPNRVFVPLPDWQDHYARASWEEQADDHARWTREAFGLEPEQCLLNSVRSRGAA